MIPLVMMLVMGVLSCGFYLLSRGSSDAGPLDDNPSELKAAIRFGLMYAAVLFAGAVALLRYRQPDPSRIVAIAALVTVCSDPLVTMSPGFRLSFGAVAILLWFSRSQTSRRGVVLRVVQLATIQVLLLLGLLPLVGLSFRRIALGAPLTNLVAVPLFSVLTVPFALAGLILQGSLEAIGDICLATAAFSIGALEPVLASVSQADRLTVPLPQLGGAGLVFIALTPLLVMLPSGWPGRWVAWLGLFALMSYTPRSPGAAPRSASSARSASSSSRWRPNSVQPTGTWRSASRSYTRSRSGRASVSSCAASAPR